MARSSKLARMEMPALFDAGRAGRLSVIVKRKSS